MLKTSRSIFRAAAADASRTAALLTWRVWTLPIIRFRPLNADGDAAAQRLYLRHLDAMRELNHVLALASSVRRSGRVLAAATAWAHSEFKSPTSTFEPTRTKSGVWYNSV